SAALRCQRSYCNYPTDIIGLFLGDCGDPGTGMPQSPVIEDWERQYNQFGNLSNGITPAYFSGFSDRIPLAGVIMNFNTNEPLQSAII
ncbi:MAG: hypothetical protein ABRQ33_11065, partial [Smithellaceae bacterium]